jgi:hypothetical protein
MTSGPPPRRHWVSGKPVRTTMDIHATAERFGFDEKSMPQRTVAFAARFIDCDPATIRRLIKMGVLHNTRPGRRCPQVDFAELVQAEGRTEL